MKKRFFDTKAKELKGTPYDSLLEKDLHNGVLKNCQHHPDKVEYVSKHKYEPDFRSGNLLIEVKGRFRDSQEASKYKWVREALPADLELVFVFSDPDLKFPFAKRRKDGTHMTHGEWATTNKFRWFTETTIASIL